MRMFAAPIRNDYSLMATALTLQPFFRLPAIERFYRFKKYNYETRRSEQFESVSRSGRIKYAG